MKAPRLHAVDSTGTKNAKPDPPERYSQQYALKLLKTDEQSAVAQVKASCQSPRLERQIDGRTGLSGRASEPAGDFDLYEAIGAFHQFTVAAPVERPHIGWDRGHQQPVARLQ